MDPSPTNRRDDALLEGSPDETATQRNGLGPLWNGYAMNDIKLLVPAVPDRQIPCAPYLYVSAEFSRNSTAEAYSYARHQARTPRRQFRARAAHAQSCGLSHKQGLYAVQLRVPLHYVARHIPAGSETTYYPSIRAVYSDCDYPSLCRLITSSTI